MQQIIQQLLEYALGMWRFRWPAMAVAWLVCVGGWVGVYAMPNSYEATSRVYVDTENVLRPLLRGLFVETNVMNEVGLMTRALLSRPQLTKVARASDLDLTVDSPEELELLLEDLRDRISVAGGRDHVFTITYSDSSRDRAERVTSTLLDTFVEDTLGSGQEDSRQAEQTLARQLQEYEQRLNASEERLKVFKQENVGLMPDERGDYYTQLQQVASELGAARQAIRISEQRRTELQKQLTGEEPVFGIMGPRGGSLATPWDEQINALEQQLAGLRIEFTDRHPEIIRIQEILGDLTVKRDALLEEAKERGASMGPSPLDVNPVYQNIRIALSNEEVQLATLQAQLRELEAKRDELQQLVNVIPQVEAELARLNRDYEVVKDRHGEMLNRWEDLQTAKRVSSGTDSVQFRIIDPPYAPVDPAGPNRPLFMAIVLVVGLGVGIGVALLLDQPKPVYSTRQGLTSALGGVPVLGTVDLWMDTGRSWRRRLDEFGVLGGALLLLVVFGLAVAFAEPGSALVRELVGTADII